MLLGLPGQIAVLLSFVPVPGLALAFEIVVEMSLFILEEGHHNHSFHELTRRAALLMHTLNEKMAKVPVQLQTSSVAAAISLEDQLNQMDHEGGEHPETLALTNLRHPQPQANESALLRNVAALQELLEEMKQYMQSFGKKNILSKMLNQHACNLRMQCFEQNLLGMAVTLQLSISTWDTSSITKETNPTLPPTLQETAQLDQAELLEYFQKAFEDQEQNMDLILDKLNVKDSELVDSLEQVQSNMSRFENRVQMQLLEIRDKLISKSGRSLQARRNYTIDINDLEFNPANKIGMGSFGEVFIGKWEQKTVAIKRSLVLLTSGDVVKEIDREASVWFPLKHPNVVVLWGACLNTDFPILVMPYFAKGNLMRYVHKHADLSLQRRLNLVLDIAYGLRYLHKEGVVHGDLKADNVLIDDAGRAVVADFGMSKVKSITNSTNAQKKTAATRWISPESYKRGSRNNEASDVFAFGMTSYQAITGKLPFHEEWRDNIVERWILDGERPDQDLSVAPEGVWNFLQCCWDHDPFKRPSFDTCVGMLKVIIKIIPKSSSSDASVDDSSVNNISTVVEGSEEIGSPRQRAIHLQELPMVSAKEGSAQGSSSNNSYISENEQRISEQPRPCESLDPSSLTRSSTSISSSSQASIISESEETSAPLHSFTIPPKKKKQSFGSYLFDWAMNLDPHYTLKSAISSRDVFKVRSILNDNKKMNTGENNNQAMKIAISFADLEIVKLLLAHQNTRLGVDRDEILQMAVDSRNDEILKFVEDFQDPPAPLLTSSTNLHEAVVRGDSSLVNALLADRELIPSDETIELAVVFHQSTILRAILGHSNAIPSVRALKTAVGNHDTAIVKILLANERTEPSAGNNAALRVAIGNRESSLVKHLLNHPRTVLGNDKAELIKIALSNSDTTIVKLLSEFKDPVEPTPMARATTFMTPPMPPNPPKPPMPPMPPFSSGKASSKPGSSSFGFGSLQQFEEGMEYFGKRMEIFGKKMENQYGEGAKGGSSKYVMINTPGGERFESPLIPTPPPKDNPPTRVLNLENYLNNTWETFQENLREDFSPILYNSDLLQKLFFPYGRAFNKEVLESLTGSSSFNVKKFEALLQPFRVKFKDSDGLIKLETVRRGGGELPMEGDSEVETDENSEHRKKIEGWLKWAGVTEEQLGKMPKNELTFAFKKGYDDIVECWLLASLPYEKKYLTKYLQMAVRTENIRLIKLLGGMGVDPNQPASHGSTPLCKAVLSRSLEVCKVLLDDLHADVNCVANPREVARDLNKNSTVIGVRIYVDAEGENTGPTFPLSSENFNKTPLYLAASTHNLVMVKFLISRGANPNLSSIAGTIPLNIAAFLGNLEVCKVLIEEGGASVNLPPKVSSPLHMAAKGGKIQVCKYLLSCGGNLEARDEKDQSVSYVAKNKHPIVYRFLRKARDDNGAPSSKKFIIGFGHED